MTRGQSGLAVWLSVGACVVATAAFVLAVVALASSQTASRTQEHWAAAQADDLRGREPDAAPNPDRTAPPDTGVVEARMQWTAEAVGKLVGLARLLEPLVGRHVDFRLQSLERWAHADPAFRPTRFYTVERWKVPAVYYLSVFGVRDIPDAVRLASLALRSDGSVVQIKGSEIVPEAGVWRWEEGGLLIRLPPSVPHLGNKTLLFRRATASADRVDGFHASAIGAQDGEGSSVGLTRDVAYDAGLGVIRGDVRAQHVAEHGDALDAVDLERQAGEAPQTLRRLQYQP
jgi:hypothetical protein